MKICLKWVHMVRYGLILRLDEALWLRIIFKTLLTPKGAIKIKKNNKKVLKSVPNQPSAIQQGWGNRLTFARGQQNCILFSTICNAWKQAA